MASTSSYLEQGYEKIYRWCSFEFRQMGRDIQLEVNSNMQQAICRLSQRPELLSEALAFLTQTRQTGLLSAFLDALTRGGPYVVILLAWVHQAIAAELRIPWKACLGLEASKKTTAELGDGWRLTKLCVPLKVRVQQTVRSQESSIVSYKVANLLQYYMLTMRRTIGEDALLSTTLSE
ncbi:oligomeric Golgi complex subunit 6 [Suillus lakei]|nr:oligomeric Golgi complex subunit 6 [Suillus lakei]